LGREQGISSLEIKGCMYGRWENKGMYMGGGKVRFPKRKELEAIRGLFTMSITFCNRESTESRSFYESSESQGQQVHTVRTSNPFALS